MYKLLALFTTVAAAAPAAPPASPLAIVIDPAMEVFQRGVEALSEVSGWVLGVPQLVADVAIWAIDFHLAMPQLIKDVLQGDKARPPRPPRARPRTFFSRDVLTFNLVRRATAGTRMTSSLPCRPSSTAS